MNSENDQLETLYETGSQTPRDLSWVTPEITKSRPFCAYLEKLDGVTWDDWNEPEVREQNLAIMQLRSSLTNEVVTNRQGWLFPEKVYLGDPNYFSRASDPQESIDRYIMRQPMCHSLRTRFQFISGILLTAVEKCGARRVRRGGRKVRRAEQ